MKKGLFVLFDGISSTIFESQVLTHVNDMRNSNIDLDILSFDPYSKGSWILSNKNKDRFSKSTKSSIFLKRGFNVYIPFTFILNLFLFLFFIFRNKNSYDFFHARADYTAFILLLSKPFHRKPVLWDCRGDSLDELKFALSKKNWIIKNVLGVYLIFLQKIMIYIACKFSTSAIFVSESLYFQHKPYMKTKFFRIIPCLVDSKLFYFSESLRNKARNDLGITLNENLYIYSGSMVPYQGVSEQILIYKKILENPLNKIIILTSMVDEANQVLSNILNDRITIKNACFTKMNYYYNASDFSFLIRDNNRLNYVASPTKFGEYCLCGLFVIMNDTVEQARSISLRINNYVNVKDAFNKEKLSNNRRKIIGDDAKMYFSRQSLRAKYVDLYNYMSDF
ncbi:TPA: hypothetical protein ACX6RV_003549 [Photobacterium damselae]